MSPRVLSEALEMVPAIELRTHPDNPRRGDLELIGESVRANGFFGALVVQRSTGRILAGNHRFTAGRVVGMTEFPVLYVDVDDEEALRILLADNRTADVAGYDDQALLAALEAMCQSALGLAGTGFDERARDDLMRRVETAASEAAAFADAGAPAEDSEDPWVPIDWIIGRGTLPQGAAKVVKQAVDTMVSRGEVSPRAPWMALEFWAIEYMNSGDGP